VSVINEEMPSQPSGGGIRDMENIMTARSTPSTKRLLIAAFVALAPVGSALAAGDCADDPAAPYHRSFYADGQHQCTPAAARQAGGARGPAGPLMATDAAGAMADKAGRGADDPFAGVRRVFIGD
jgi:hypothetical protein